LNLDQFKFQSGEKFLEEGHPVAGIWGGGKMAEKLIDDFRNKRGSEI